MFGSVDKTYSVKECKFSNIYIIPVRSNEYSCIHNTEEWPKKTLSSNHKYRLKKSILFHQEIEGKKKKDNIRGSCCTKEKKSREQDFSNHSFLIGKTTLINIMQKKKGGDGASRKETLTVIKRNMIMLSDLMSTSHNDDIWNISTSGLLCYRQLV